MNSYINCKFCKNLNIKDWGGESFLINKNGEEKYLNVVISKNGYIVTSHPLNKDELNRIKWK